MRQTGSFCSFRESGVVRKPLLVSLAIGAVLALAACSSASSPTPTSTSTAAACANTPSGSTSKSVKVTGAFRAAPTVTFASPLKATTTQRTLVVTGKGKKVAPGSTVDIALAAYNGTTGKELTSNGFTTAPIPVTVDDTQFIPGLVRAIECVPVGSRIVTTASVKSAFGNADPTSLGLKTTDSVVFVTDVIDIVPTRANGKPVAPTPGFPTVKLDSTGKPTVTIPKTTPPTTTQIAELKQGSGTTVQAGDTVTVQYQGTIWNTGKVFDQSWGRSIASFQTSAVVPGFSKALVGQKVGSQVIAVIPPADGYGSAGNSSAGITGTDTLVFVVDILATSR
jgi:peptidylprolyl isomerase